MDTDTIAAIYDSFGFDERCNRQWVIDNVSDTIKSRGGLYGAANELRITLESLGRYKSRDISACARIVERMLRQEEAKQGA
jgi:hypothetical protein